MPKVTRGARRAPYPAEVAGVMGEPAPATKPKWAPPAIIEAGSGDHRDPSWMLARATNVETASWVVELEEAMSATRPWEGFAEFDRAFVRSMRAVLDTYGDAITDPALPCVVSGRQLVVLHFIYSKLASKMRAEMTRAR